MSLSLSRFPQPVSFFLFSFLPFASLDSSLSPLAYLSFFLDLYISFRPPQLSSLPSVLPSLTTRLFHSSPHFFNGQRTLVLSPSRSYFLVCLLYELASKLALDVLFSITSRLASS
ncbi:hypothetical protein BDY24DRAFT_398615 [Mrakia frigida]|uniref:uncharacterized protein n=1 Tax=Mrakia frigida TaxID=29902 RepID=UPI003FCC15F1